MEWKEWNGFEEMEWNGMEWKSNGMDQMEMDQQDRNDWKDRSDADSSAPFTVPGFSSPCVLFTLLILARIYSVLHSIMEMLPAGVGAAVVPFHLAKLQIVPGYAVCFKQVLSALSCFLQ